MVEISELKEELSRLRAPPSGGVDSAAEDSVDAQPFLSKIVGPNPNPESDDSGVWSNSMAKRASGLKKRGKK